MLRRGPDSSGTALVMRLLSWRAAMPSQQYDRVTNDEFDTRVPLHPDEAFEYGIKFNAKYIGSMEVPRPSSRVEIVAAMRRVRYEFKAKGAKKRKVVVDVSTEGVRVLARKKTTKRKEQDLMKLCNGEGGAAGELLHHPIYRIFYVSHDSSDLKIFSYIARDPATNAFKCNVFKSSKKSMAMRIVRTVGQAFEVCHKQQAGSEGAPSSADAMPATPAPAALPTTTTTPADIDAKSGDASECESTELAAPVPAPVSPAAFAGSGPRPLHLDLLPPPPRKEPRKSPQRSTELPEVEAEGAGTPLGAQHELQLLRERLEQQTQQTRAAVAQLLLLRDQLAAEQAARCEAQARTHQLLVHNKELLEHIAALVAHLQARERPAPSPRSAPHTSRPLSAMHLTLLPQDSPELKFDNDFEMAYLQEQRKKTEILVNLLNENDVAQNNNNNVVKTPTPPSHGRRSPESPTTDLEHSDRPPINYNQHFFQNSNAFPNIPPLSSDVSNMNISHLCNQNLKSDRRWTPSGDGNEAAARGFSFGSAGSSKESSPEADSSDEGVAFIMPLSHRGTLTAPAGDGRVRLIVPVSPAGSVANVPALAAAGPGAGVGARLGSPGVVARSTSERAPHRSEMMSALRAQWTRHTTK